ncbi:hypothetical protein CEXT_748101 [Caerostris extrusa]|uniref:Mitochondrial ribosomal protein S14 n=1 Tax=Caerostris extrusa TaxID=172846 RepID=A0AAV4QRW8_CAEEX|nr:hypothetical protein CEXT_748101 [Caerostris extrusa]
MAMFFGRIVSRATQRCTLFERFSTNASWVTNGSESGRRGKAAASLTASVPMHHPILQMSLWYCHHLVSVHDRPRFWCSPPQKKKNPRDRLQVQVKPHIARRSHELTPSEGQCRVPLRLQTHAGRVDCTRLIKTCVRFDSADGLRRGWR